MIQNVESSLYIDTMEAARKIKYWLDIRLQSTFQVYVKTSEELEGYVAVGIQLPTQRYKLQFKRVYNVRTGSVDKFVDAVVSDLKAILEHDIAELTESIPHNPNPGVENAVN